MLSQLSNNIPANHEPQLFTVESVALLAKTLKQCNEYYCFILNFTHRAAHGIDNVSELNHYREQLLYELKKEYLTVFSESKYHIWEY